MTTTPSLPNLPPLEDLPILHNSVFFKSWLQELKAIAQPTVLYIAGAHQTVSSVWGVVLPYPLWCLLDEHLITDEIPDNETALSVSRMQRRPKAFQAKVAKMPVILHAGRPPDISMMFTVVNPTHYEKLREALLADA
jgi:hypothetical protein